MSGRMQKINNQIKRDLGVILQQDVGDPRIAFVTITNADVSPDLRNARVYFSVLGDAAKIQDAQKALNSAAGMIRKMLSRRMNLRVTPLLTFIYDKSIAHSFEIEEALKRLNEDE